MHDGILKLTLRLARTPVAGLDAPRVLSGLCTDLAAAVDVASALLVVLDPSGVHGSDETAVLLGQAQHPAAVGPVASAIRSGRPLLTPDLTRVGPPVLAAVAADCGLVSSGVVPLRAGTCPVGALQMLGSAVQPVTPQYLESLGPLPEVLACFLANLASCISRLPVSSETREVTVAPLPRTVRLPVVPPARSSPDDHNPAAAPSVHPA